MGFLKRLFGDKKPPASFAGNPGIATGGEVAFCKGDRTWSKSFDLVPILAGLLRERGHAATPHKTWIELSASGLVLQPKIVEIEPLEGGGARTVTTIDVRHSTLIAQGLYEYQHATGDTVVTSLGQGFAGWEEVDLRVMLDALRTRPEYCTCIEMPFPAKDGKPARKRRAVLGNVLRYSS